jgi:HD-like signal output (HDOD) protein
MRKDSILELVDKLPPLPKSIQEIEKLFTGSTFVETAKLVKIIEEDTALTADILSFANSPFFGFSKSIQSIHQAVVLFGAAQTRKMALKSAIFSSFNIDMSAYGITNEKFVQISSMQSELIFQWYMGIDIEKSKLLLPVAFLMEAGSIVISRYILDNNLKDNFLNDIKNISIKTAEIRHTSMTTLQVNYILFEHWGLNEVFSKTMHTLDNELYQTDDFIKELSFPLKVVRETINLKEQLTDESIKKGAGLLNQTSYETSKFIHACQRVRKKFQLD